MIPIHWRLRGIHRVKAVDRLLRSRDVAGAHVFSVTRLLRIGPWSLMVFRYRPGQVDDVEG